VRVVFISGPQGSGKTSLVPKYTKNLGFSRINRDTEGSKMDKLFPKFEKMLKNGEDVVLDNTFCTAEDRRPWIDIAKQYNATIESVYMKTSKDDCLINACKRMIENYGKVPEKIKNSKKSQPDIFPPAAIFSYFKRHEIPDVSEGFHKMETVKFKRTWSNYLKNKGIIFDYDGTLRYTQGGNGKYPTCHEEQGFYEGREKFILPFKEKGYKLLGATNQSGVANGHLTIEMCRELLDATNKHLGLEIDYSICPHSVPPVACYCRKPGSQMGLEFIYKYNIHPDNMIMVGDQTSDKTFAKRLGFEFVHADEFFK